MEKDKRLHIRISSAEYELLSQHCQETMRTQSDVIRELIRTLKVKN
ncbi:MAG: ribbon-helix-helix protein, CopG family [Tolypothrix sp. T3-bin4]|nr:ribbon-helix-helix protein, CopG family [Tolypothrix sp. T3-bin4]